MVDTAFISYLGNKAGVSPAELDRLGTVVEEIRLYLTEAEIDDFALELLDAVRRADQQSMKTVLADWGVTAMLRRHPDFDQQRKEYENLVSSGELMQGAIMASQLAS